MTHPLHSLPTEQQSQQYRELADGALRSARQTANPEQQAEYMRLALGWHSMAHDAEARSSNLAAVEKRLHRSEPRHQN
jgi:hypothetical protein